MDSLFLILGFASLIAIFITIVQMIIGLIRKSEKSRKKQLLIVIGVFIISLVGFNSTMNTTKTAKESSKLVENQDKEKEIQEKEDETPEKESDKKKEADEEKEKLEKELEETKKELEEAKKELKENVEKEKELKKEEKENVAKEGIEKKVNEPQKVEEKENKRTENIELDEDSKVDAAVDILKTNFKDLADISVNKSEKYILLTPKGDFKTSVMYLAVSGGNQPELLEAWDTAVDSMINMSDSMSKVIPGYSINIVNPANTENVLLTIIDGILIYDFVNDF